MLVIDMRENINLKSTMRNLQSIQHILFVSLLLIHIFTRKLKPINLANASNSGQMAEKLLENKKLRIFLDTENVNFIPAVFAISFQG